MGSAAIEEQATEQQQTDAAEKATADAAAAQASTDAAAKEAADKAAAEAAKPVEYKLELPANAVLDATAIEKMTATARASGFSPEQAQTALDLANTFASEQREQLLAAYQPGGAEWGKQLDGWKAETLADATLGKTEAERLAAVQKGAQVIDRFVKASPELGTQFKEFLNASGFGEHRVVAHFFKWLGDAASEGTVVDGAPPGGKPKTIGGKMYPNLPES
jgi:hypothetical protein